MFPNNELCSVRTDTYKQIRFLLIVFPHRCSNLQPVYDKSLFPNYIFNFANICAVKTSYYWLTLTKLCNALGKPWNCLKQTIEKTQQNKAQRTWRNFQGERPEANVRSSIVPGRRQLIPLRPNWQTIFQNRAFLGRAAPLASWYSSSRIDPPSA